MDFFLGGLKLLGPLLGPSLRVASVLMVVASFAANAEIYKWVDENGKVHFGERAPVNQASLPPVTLKSSYTPDVRPVRNSTLWQNQVKSIVRNNWRDSRGENDFRSSMSERIGTIFNGRVNKISLKSRRRNSAWVNTEIVYGQGDLFILDQGIGSNFFTDGDYLYEWKSGSKQGIKYAKDEADIVDYVYYLTDVTHMYSNIYAGYSAERRCQQDCRFTKARSSSGAWSEVSRQDSGMTLYVDLESLWFHGMSAISPDGTDSVEIVVDRPVAADGIPQGLVEAMSKVIFKTSSKSLQNHIKYL